MINIFGTYGIVSSEQLVDTTQFVIFLDYSTAPKSNIKKIENKDSTA